jgi:ABC-type antimicrobial peptide transport system permease subunit
MVKFTTMDDEIDASLLLDRVIAMLSEVFGSLGAMVAAISLYGLLSYKVAWRTREIGIRFALGATRGIVMRLVLSNVLKVVAAGLCVGIPVSYWAMRFAQSSIADLQAQGGFSVIAGSAGIVSIALVAAFLPARRASRIDPIETLRHE